MRNRLSLFAFAIILLAGATAFVAASDSVPLCLFAGNPQGTEVAGTKPTPIHRVASTYTLEERDYLIRTVAFEAPRETHKGKAAVAHVILNRKMSGRWGDNIKDVVTRPWQFEPWITRRKEIAELSPNDPRHQTAARITDAVGAVRCPHGQVAREFRLVATPFTRPLRPVQGLNHLQMRLLPLPERFSCKTHRTAEATSPFLKYNRLDVVYGFSS